VEIQIRCVVVDYVAIEAHDCEELARFLVISVGLHHQLESKDERCTEPPEGSSAVDVARDILFARAQRKTMRNRLHFGL
jgi:hypothetical protein